MSEYTVYVGYKVAQTVEDPLCQMTLGRLRAVVDADPKFYAKLNDIEIPSGMDESRVRLRDCDIIRFCGRICGIGPGRPEEILEHVTKQTGIAHPAIWDCIENGIPMALIKAHVLSGRLEVGGRGWLHLPYDR